jgi:ubiquinone/menaquinone biosynthesis C-methylase UbiE
MLLNYLPEKTVRTAAGLLKDYKGNVADIACGKGPLLKELLPLKDKRIVGVDQSSKQLSEAHTAGMPVALGNILVMPFKSGIFDIAICLNTIYNFSSLPEFQPAFTEMIRIINDNGKIVIDIRNRRNPVIRIKNWLHNRKNLFPTVPYIPEDITRAMNVTGCRLVRKKAVGINNRYLAWGYIMIFERETGAQ